MAYKPFGPQDQLQIASLGTEFALAEIIGAVVGFWLDKKLGTLPWFLLGGAVMGFVWGLMRIVQVAKQANREVYKGKQNGRS